MAAILLVVAWNIADFHQVVRFYRNSPKPDVLVMLSCLTLTVLFDMVIAIAVGVVLAALLFMRDISRADQSQRYFRNIKMGEPTIATRLVGLQNHRPAVLRGRRSYLC